MLCNVTRKTYSLCGLEALRSVPDTKTLDTLSCVHWPAIAQECEGASLASVRLVITGSLCKPSQMPAAGAAWACLQGVSAVRKEGQQKGALLKALRMGAGCLTEGSTLLSLVVACLAR